MPQYTNQERLNLYNCYVKNNKSPALALREYRREFPNARIPNKKIFENICKDLSTHGVLKYKKREKGHSVTSEEFQMEVLLYFTEHPTHSLREAERDLNFKKTSIYRVLKQHKISPYKFRPVQFLKEADHQARLDFCMEMMDLNFERDIFRNILWTDEAIFTTAGTHNRRNCHYYADSNQHLERQIKKQGRQSVKVWCGIINDRIIGPVFFDQYLNRQTFLNLLQNQIMELVNQLPEDFREFLVFQQDNAPYHCGEEIRAFLNAHFNLSIYKNGDISMPPRSPDLTPPDFFCGAHLKIECIKIGTIFLSMN